MSLYQRLLLLLFQNLIDLYMHLYMYCAYMSNIGKHVSLNVLGHAYNLNGFLIYQCK